MIGGFDGDNALKDVSVYMPSLENSSDDPWSSTEPMPEARYAMGAVELTDAIFVIGGINEQEQELAPVRYSTQEHSWMKLVDQESEPRAYLGLAALGPKIYAIGGEINKIPSNLTYAYQAIFVVVLPVVP